MTKDNTDNSGKWSDATTSYEDAMAIKRLVKKVKDQKDQEQRGSDKTSP